MFVADVLARPEVLHELAPRDDGVRLLGDIAIYVSPGSADHRAYPELFQTGVVAGAPPADFAPTGQPGGNPLYDWPALQRRRYRWWVARMRRTVELFDVARIDHFRGFVSYWAVPEREATAVNGHWKRGPGRALFKALAGELGGLPFVAEDLGIITPAVEALRDELGLPGMLVLQFGFDPDDPHGPHRPENHVENRIVYTGTHDSDTARGWYESLDEAPREGFERELASRGLDQVEPWWGMIELAFSSPARVAMVQVQDVLGLGSEARMNVPGQAGESWSWKLQPGALTPELAAHLRELTARADRLPR